MLQVRLENLRRKNLRLENLRGMTLAKREGEWLEVQDSLANFRVC